MASSVSNRRPRASRYACLAVCAWVYLRTLSTDSQLAWASLPEHKDRLARRSLLSASMLTSAATADANGVRAFTPGDLMSGKPATSSATSEARFKAQRGDEKGLQDALVLISRVQEATVQEERLVTTGKFKDLQRNSIRMALTMMMDNYRLGDQIVIAAAFIEPSTKVLPASQIGNEAVDALVVANEYFAKELKATKLTEEQRKFLVTALTSCRQKLDDFLAYLPSEAVQKARRQVEEENALNAKEFVGDDGGIVNPVTLPWKKA